jgi:invasion protein IalB
MYDFLTSAIDRSERFSYIQASTNGARQAMTSALTPLPSLIRASASDAANMQMRKAGRSKWSRADWNKMCDVQERLIRSCYGRASDDNEPNRCYLRFQIAEQLEKRGDFGLRSDVTKVMSFIDAALAA